MKNKKIEIITVGDLKFKVLFPELLPKITNDEYERLSSSIKEMGVLVPVITDEEKGVIDGANRLRVVAEHKLKSIQFNIMPGLTESKKKQLAIKLNAQRRHMTKEQRLALATDLRKDGLSLRQIAEILNVSHATVDRLLGTATTNTAEFPDKVKGKDGKKHPAKKPKPKKCIIAKNLSEAKKAFDACVGIDSSNLPNSNIDIKRAAMIKRKVKLEKKRNQEYEDFKAGEAELLLGDFRVKGQKEIADESVDLFFTDPPYAKDALPIWNDLSKFAARVLKSGGLLVSYSGCLYLPQIHNMLGKHLTYLWTAAIYHTGGKKLVSAVKVQQAWKPILIYYKAPLKKYWKPFIDMVSGGQAKSNHDWEQSVAEAAHYIKALCPKKGILLDPMMGSGTTLVAGINLGIKCIGIEIDKAAYSTAQDRVQRVLDELNTRKESA